MALSGQITGSVLDKKALWLQVLDDLSGQLDMGVFFRLRNDTWLDNLTFGKAVLAVRTGTLQTLCEKRLARTIEKAFSEAMDRPVSVSIVLGRSKIIEKRQKQDAMTHNRDESEELQRLHQTYGDIMGIVDNHPIFCKASLPMTAGGWGIFPQVLTNACKDYGVLTVLNGLRDTASRPKARNPRAFFLAALKRGDYGYKLARGADILGL
jgi:hypothetical protein